MTYEEALKTVNHRLRFGMKPGLERIQMLLERLGNPQKQLRFVHVAGTNGKGTTCTLLAGALQAAGYRTGLYTSPYVLEFRERFGDLNSFVLESLRGLDETIQYQRGKDREEERIPPSPFVAQNQR